MFFYQFILLFRTVPTRAPAQLPTPAPPAAVAAPAAPSQGSGLLGQMAATAGGVAIGHTVGHAITGMFSGGSGGSEVAQAAPAAPAQQAVPQHSYEPNGPCAWEVKQFLDCAGNNADITLCQGFNEAMQQCKLRNSKLPMMKI